mmetsp:Transcript_8215/g.21765  ORF Transcript_8215/g.21765 Transcript_8215/m.21765 type:complete len:661 (+) Transcript_8215:1330-3312(+)
MMTRSGVESLGFLLGEMDWKRTLCKNWMKKNRTKKIFKNTLCYGATSRKSSSLPRVLLLQSLSLSPPPPPPPLPFFPLPFLPPPPLPPPRADVLLTMLRISFTLLPSPAVTFFNFGSFHGFPPICSSLSFFRLDSSSGANSSLLFETLRCVRLPAHFSIDPSKSASTFSARLMMVIRFLLSKKPSGSAAIWLPLAFSTDSSSHATRAERSEMPLRRMLIDSSFARFAMLAGSSTTLFPSQEKFFSIARLPISSGRTSKPQLEISSVSSEARRETPPSFVPSRPPSDRIVSMFTSGHHQSAGSTVPAGTPSEPVPALAMVTSRCFFSRAARTSGVVGSGAFSSAAGAAPDVALSPPAAAADEDVALDLLSFIVSAAARAARPPFLLASSSLFSLLLSPTISSSSSSSSSSPPIVKNDKAAGSDVIATDPPLFASFFKASSSSGNRLAYSAGSASASAALRFTFFRSLRHSSTTSDTWLGTYVRAKKAASGTRPAVMSNSTHSFTRPSTNSATNATLYFPDAAAFAASASTPLASPRAVESRSLPERSFAASRQLPASPRSPFDSVISPSCRQRCSESNSPAISFATGRLPSCIASSKRYSGSVAIERASSGIPRISRKRATEFFSASGICGSTSAAASMSPRRTSVLYSTTPSNSVYEQMV